MTTQYYLFMFKGCRDKCDDELMHILGLFYYQFIVGNPQLIMHCSLMWVPLNFDAHIEARKLIGPIQQVSLNARSLQYSIGDRRTIYEVLIARLP